MSSQLVILDRDGVINHDRDDYVRSASQWQPIDGSIAAIAALSRAGFTVTVATNQSGIGRGLYSRSALYAMNRKLRRLVAAAGGTLAAIAFCPHTPAQNCECRKPRIGMLRQIAERTGLSLKGAALVGDSLRDLQAGQQVGCRLWLVRTGNGVGTQSALAAPSAPAWSRDVTIVSDLAAASAHIIRQGRG